MSPLRGGKNAIVRNDADWMKKGMTVKDPNKITKIDRDIEVTIRKISRLKLSKLIFEFREGEIIESGSVGENTNVKNKSPKTVG